MSDAPRAEPKWLTLRQVVSIQEELISRFGGQGGLRDRGLLLARPKQKWRYEDTPTLAELAAAYAFGICKNHPFYDGNKRAGATAVAAFLYLNGHVFQADEAELVSVMEGVAAGEITEAQVAVWIHEGMTAR